MFKTLIPLEESLSEEQHCILSETKTVGASSAQFTVSRKEVHLFKEYKSIKV